MKVPQSISFDLDVLQELQKKAYEEKTSVSKIVNDVVKESLTKKNNQSTNKKGTK
jgi:metal-responsive CopG/Arc/MetJ family transcriptional regulator